MRLNQHYQTVIKTTLRKHFGDGSNFYLFGSRTDDNKRGGDIDLYIETDFSDATRAHKATNMAHLEMMKLLGEQKIDIIVHIDGEEFTSFEKLAKQTGIPL